MLRWCGRGDLERILAIDSVVSGAAVAIASVLGNMTVVGMLILLLLVCPAASVIAATAIKNAEHSRTIHSKGKTIRIRQGDIFEQEGIIVIPVNRCFDTLVDDNIIAGSSLHGKFILRFFRDDTQILDRIIEKQLSNARFDRQHRTRGKEKCYAPGTVVSIGCDNRTYILLALTEFDENNNAGCTLPDYCRAIEDLLNYLNVHCQGRKVSIPLIGGGLSRMNSSPEDLLELLIALIKTDSHDCPKDIGICLTENTLESIDLSKIH